MLERRTARLRALLRLCIVLLRLSGFSLVSRRLPNGDDKQKLLRSIDHASRFVRLPRLLQWIGISSTRYYDRKNSQECGLNDASSRPKPNEYWHFDATIVRLVDGSRVYLQAVLDNYSRRILAWRLSERFDTTITAEILQKAAKALAKNTAPSAVMDSGVENVNAKVNEIVSDGTIKRVLAQVDIAQSNSMIEAWWRQLKHQWLFLNELDSATSVRKLVGFYVEQHNTVVPHFAFEGQTPDEIYIGTGASVPAKLKEKRAEARAARLAHNRAVTCARCKIEDTKPAMVTMGSNTS